MPAKVPVPKPVQEPEKVPERAPEPAKIPVPAKVPEKSSDFIDLPEREIPVMNVEGIPVNSPSPGGMIRFQPVPGSVDESYKSSGYLLVDGRKKPLDDLI